MAEPILRFNGSRPQSPQSARVIPFPSREGDASGRSAFPTAKRDRRRKLPANVIDLARIRDFLPGDRARDVEEVRSALLCHWHRSFEREVTGLAVLVDHGETFRLVVSGAYRYEPDALVLALERATGVARRQASRTLIDRIENQGLD
jgi:hypothetical protein